MIWKNRIRTNPLLRKLIHSDGTEENVTIDDIPTNVTQIGTPLDESTLNIQEKNIGTYGDDTYDNTKTYSIGDIVTYRGLLYKCTSPIETAENFNASHWEEFSLLSKIQKNENDIIEDKENIIQNSNKIETQTTQIENISTEVNMNSQEIESNKIDIQTLYDGVFYKVGDSFSYYCKVAVTAASTTLFRFQIPLNKVIPNGVKASVSIISGTLYQSGNSFAINANNITNLSVSNTSTTLLEVVCNLSTALTYTAGRATTGDIRISVNFIEDE